MATGSLVDWDVCEVCAAEGGTGIRMPSGGRCWEHADEQDLVTALKRLGGDGRLDARGVSITAELLDRLLTAAPGDDRGHAILTDALFDRAAFEGDAPFDGVIFQGNAGFRGAVFRHDAGFQHTAFPQARQLGPMLVHKRLVLDDALFYERIQIEVSAAVMSCRRARFLAGVQLRVRWAQLVLDDADLAAPSILTGVSNFPDLDEGPWAQEMAKLRETGSATIKEMMLLSPEMVSISDQLAPLWRISRARLISLRRADVAGLTVAGVDLRACRFAGALHLDQFRIEESNFGSTPKGWHWTARQVIAEERQWRAQRYISGVKQARDTSLWYGPPYRPPDWLEAEKLTAGQIAGLYRALRKGREDSKDEPGAADFYYGEMEMRRSAGSAWSEVMESPYQGTRSGAELIVLSLYWLLSGYGLRAWRSLASLVVVIVFAGVGFAFWGFAPPTGLQELPGAIWFSAEAATALLRGPDQPLTNFGRGLHLAVRLLGPTLLGLAVLSIRGRVKR
jgi:hypothetical protein